jgi:hypothetical protein
MKTFLLNLVSPSVDSLTSSLGRTVSRLEKLAERKSGHALALRAQADATHDVADRQEAEALRASRAAQRIAKLVA